MEKLTNNIAGKVAVELNLNNDNKEVIAYGIFALLHMALSIILVIIFGLMFHVMIEALIICFAGSILRKFSGGAHASSPGKCAAIGTVICVGLALLILFLIGPETTSLSLILIGLGVFSLAFYLVYKLAPVDSPAKPIRKKEKKIRMKKGSILVLSVYIIIVVVNICIYYFLHNNRFLVYSLCMYGGIAWQSFTLTRAGHRTMNKMDAFLSPILIITKGGK